MADLEARFRISLDGRDELRSFFRDTEQQATSFQSRIGSVMKSAGEEFSRFAISATRALSSIAGFNLSISGQVKNVLEFRDAVNKLHTMANDASVSVDGLRREIVNAAVASGQLKEEVTEALDAFVAKTGDINTGRRNLELYGKVATATGATMKEVALVGAELSDKLKITDQTKAFGILAMQAGAGSIEVKDMARQAPRYLNAAAMAGLRGEEGLREYGALAQIYAKGRSGPGAAATVATEIDRTLDDVIKKRSKIEGLGISVAGRDPVKVAQDIIRHYGGNMADINASGIFGIQSRRGIAMLAQDYNDSGRQGFRTFEKFRDVQPTADEIERRYQKNMQSGAMRLRTLRNRAEQFIDQGVDFATENPYLTGALGVGAIAMRGISRGMKGGGGGLGGLIAGAQGQPVYVTNWPDSLGPGGLGGLAKGGGPGGGVFSLLANNLGLLATTLAAGYGVGTMLDNATGWSDKIADAIFNAVHGDTSGDTPKEKAAREAEARRRGGAGARSRYQLEGAGYDVDNAGPSTTVMVNGKPVDVSQGGIQMNVLIGFDEEGNPVLKENGTRAERPMAARGAGAR